MDVRHAVEMDALEIARVHVETWQTSYRGIVPDGSLDAMSVPPRAVKWRRMLAARADTAQCVLVAEIEEGRLVGFSNAGPQGSVGNPDEAGSSAYRAEILCLYVAPGYQRKGVGTLLMRAVAAELISAGLTSASLWCLAAGPAVPFYEKLGGAVVASKQQAVGGQVLEVVCFAWPDLAPLVSPGRGVAGRPPG